MRHPSGFLGIAMCLRGLLIIGMNIRYAFFVSFVLLLFSPPPPGSSCCCRSKSSSRWLSVGFLAASICCWRCVNRNAAEFVGHASMNLGRASINLGRASHLKKCTPMVRKPHFCQFRFLFWPAFSIFFCHMDLCMLWMLKKLRF